MGSIETWHCDVFPGVFGFCPYFHSGLGELITNSGCNAWIFLKLGRVPRGSECFWSLTFLSMTATASRLDASISSEYIESSNEG